MATKTRPKTRRGTAPGPSRPLPEIARKLVIPTGIVSTDWPKVHKICTQKLGVPFDPWQQDAGRVILARRADGDLAAMVDGVGMSLPRQVGKTYLLAALTFALCILRPGLLVIWSAHHGKTHAETFLSMQGFAQRLRVAPYVRQVYKGSGDEEVRFVNGSRILFGAREHGFGRGIPGVDMLVFDEAQILSDKAMAAMLATMNVSDFGLALYIGTPPRPEDNSEAFKRMRDEAYAGTLPDGAWIEFGAERGSDPNDRTQLAKANPSYPHRTPEKSILRLQRKLTPEDFLREGYGIWDEESSGGVIPAKPWRDSTDEGSVPVERWALGVEVAPDLSWASVAIAGRRADGSWHVALEACKETHGEGVDWLSDYVSALVRLNPQIRTVVVDSTGPVKALLEQRGTGQRQSWAFISTKVRANAIRVSDLGATCAALLSGLSTGDVRHLGQAPLTTAALSAGKRALGDTGMWTWHRRAATSDITPIQAATLALHGAQMTKTTRPGGATSTGRRVVSG